jgi:hypothetical protein
MVKTVVVQIGSFIICQCLTRLLVLFPTVGCSRFQTTDEHFGTQIRIDGKFISESTFRIGYKIIVRLVFPIYILVENTLKQLHS